MEGLVYNHETCKESFGHRVEPKVFWVPLCETGVQEGMTFLETLILMGAWCSKVKGCP